MWSPHVGKQKLRMCTNIIWHGFFLEIFPWLHYITLISYLRYCLPFLSTYHSILMKHNFMFVFVSHPWLLRTFGFSLISTYNSYLINGLTWGYFQEVIFKEFGRAIFEVSDINLFKVEFWDFDLDFFSSDKKRLHFTSIAALSSGFY